jgi:uncharacterized protein YbjT (DUF2867 family)
MGVRLLILGASGLVGRHVLQLALDHSGIDRVIAPTRKALPAQAKLSNPHADRIDTLVNDVPAIDAVVCALGTTMAKAGSREAFLAVDYALPLAFAKAAHQKGAEAFALVSAIGASTSSRIFYARTKGEVERDLQKVGFRSVTVLRPMFIEGDRGEFRLGEAAVLQFCKLFSPLLPRGFRVNPASVIAEAALKAVMPPTKGVHFIYSQDLTSNPT